MQTGLRGAPAKGTSITENVKMCMKIWSAFTKYIRSQCNKDRIVDTQCLGMFYKQEGPDGPAAGEPVASNKQSQHVFVKGTKTNSFLGEFLLR